MDKFKSTTLLEDVEKSADTKGSADQAMEYKKKLEQQRAALQKKLSSDHHRRFRHSKVNLRMK